MHDETLNKGEAVLEAGPEELQSKYILDTVKALAKHYKITEDKATTALGYVLKWNDDYPHVKEVILKLDLIAAKPMPIMTNEEKLAMIAIGHLVRKIKQFRSETKKIGRNEVCPCDSGKKFKNCCLTVAKLNEVERHKNGR